MIMPTAHWLEYADWWNPILAEPLRIEKGMAIIGDAFGTGVDWNEDVVSRFSACPHLVERPRLRKLDSLPNKRLQLTLYARR